MATSGATATTVHHGVDATSARDGLIAPRHRLVPRRKLRIPCWPLLLVSTVGIALSPSIPSNLLGQRYADWAGLARTGLVPGPLVRGYGWFVRHPDRLGVAGSVSLYALGLALRSAYIGVARGRAEKYRALLEALPAATAALSQTRRVHIHGAVRALVESAPRDSHEELLGTTAEAVVAVHMMTHELAHGPEATASVQQRRAVLDAVFGAADTFHRYFAQERDVPELAPLMEHVQEASRLLATLSRAALIGRRDALDRDSAAAP